MTVRIRAIYLLSLLIMGALMGCSNSVAPVATATVGSTLSGTVAAFDATAPTPVNPLGIKVSLQGTKYETFADSLGHFSIDGIQAGVYNIIFSKPGFDSMIYPTHHLVGVGNDIINDAYLVEESTDSIQLGTISSVFSVSVRKIITVIDTIIKDSAGMRDTIVLQHDSLSITYDTVSNANALIVSGRVVGKNAAGGHWPGSIYVYSSLDSSLPPTSPAFGNPATTEDDWLRLHLTDSFYHKAFQSPAIKGGTFTDTLSRDIEKSSAYSLQAGQTVYIYAVGHSNTNGLPIVRGQYEHFSTTAFGPRAVRFKYVVP
jgi:hypothetical protein